MPKAREELKRLEAEKRRERREIEDYADITEDPVTMEAMNIIAKSIKKPAEES